MRKIVLFLLLVCSIQSLFAQNGEIISKGVIFYKEATTFVLPDSLSILNKDGSVNTKLIKQNDVIDIHYNEPPNDLNNNLALKRIYPYYYIDNDKYKAPIPNIIIRAYYPDFGVFVMDANKISDLEYEIFVNGEWKKIIKNDFHYNDWNDFIKYLLIKLPANVHLYSKKNTESKKIISNTDMSYKVLEVNGDWIKIECNSKCDDCNKKIKGWVRWKIANTLLVDLYYVC
jgi:hypothetical protein